MVVDYYSSLTYERLILDSELSDVHTEICEHFKQVFIWYNNNLLKDSNLAKGHHAFLLKYNDVNFHDTYNMYVVLKYVRT